MIVVEGMDGSGKTHVSYEIAKRLKWHVLRHGWRPKETRDLEVYRTKIEWVNHYLQNEVVVDRFSPISEYIYGPVLRGTQLVEFAHLLHLVRMSPIQSVVFCCPQPEVIYENVKDSDQLAGVKENYLDLYTRYVRVMTLLQENLDLRVINWDYPTDSFDKLMEQL